MNKVLEALKEVCERHGWEFEKAYQDLNLWFVYGETTDIWNSFNEWYEELMSREGEEVHS